MGEVWSATHLVTGGMVAVKRLRCSLHDADFREARARFLLEARSACAVEHPNVVRVFDVIEAENEAPFIVMELLEGETLAQRLSREGTLTPLETARVMLPVVSAVGSAHARFIVHRDLKPANIFLTSGQGPAGTVGVKVLDFGIAKWLGEPPPDAGVRTQTGSTLGTPAYMAPEQALGERSIDHRADIWSLGVILYECLSGVRPVDGANPAQMLMHLLRSGIIPIEHLVPDLPSGWAPVIGGALRREVSHRLPDLRPLHAALAAVCDQPCPTFESPAAVESAAPACGAPRRRALPRRLAIALGLAVIAPVVAAVWPARETSEAEQDVLEAPGSPAPSLALAPAAAAPLPRGTPEEDAPSVPSLSPSSQTEGMPGPSEPKAALASPSSPSPGGDVARAPQPRRPRPRASPPVRVSLPAGAGCEQSTQCKSRLCVAYVCR